MSPKCTQCRFRNFPYGIPWLSRDWLPFEHSHVICWYLFSMIGYHSYHYRRETRAKLLRRGWFAVSFVLLHRLAVPVLTNV